MKKRNVQYEQCLIVCIVIVCLLSERNRQHSVHNSAPIEEHTFRHLSTLLSTLDRYEIRNSAQDLCPTRTEVSILFSFRYLQVHAGAQRWESTGKKRGPLLAPLAWSTHNQ
jgi:hypothetical protein